MDMASASVTSNLFNSLQTPIFSIPADGNPSNPVSESYEKTKFIKNFYYLSTIDHCHTTGKIRGLLCYACNTAIGKLKEDPKLFEAALNYLRL